MNSALVRICVISCLAILACLNAPECAQGWQFVSPRVLNRWLHSGEEIFLVNVMSRIECFDHSIENSTCIPCEQIKAGIQAVPKDVKVVVYCESNTCHRSCRAADAAVEAGFTQVYVLEGGLPGWKREGFPTVSRNRIPRKPIPALKAHELEGWLMRHGDFTVLDIRSPDMYAQGHIKGAVSMPLFVLHERYPELPRDRGYVVVDDEGFRSFLASCYLAQKGFRVVRLFGGMARWRQTTGVQGARP